MPSSVWTGAISFGLVSIPVRLYPATEDKSVRFNLLHRKDGSRVKERYYCPKDGELFEWQELVRGYPIGGGHYVALDHEDFAQVPVKSLHTIEIVQFAKLSEIDPILFKHTYFLAPEELGAKPFALLRRTIEDTGLVAVGKLTLREKEHACVLRCCDTTIALNILFAADEVRPTDELRRADSVELDDRSVKLAEALVEELTTDFRPQAYSDPYREALVALINQRAANLQQPEPAQRPSALPDLMAALRQAVVEAREKKAREAEKAKKRDPLEV